MKILVVEDTEDARLLLIDQLQVNGYEVDDAVNGVDALQKARQRPPDLIVSDILMPEMDGFELCRQAKHDPELRKIPFVFYSATYTNAQDEQFALSLGASRFVVKPQDPKKFMRIIEDVLEEHVSGELSVPESPMVTDDVLQHLHNETLTKKLNKKVKQLGKQQEYLQLITDAMPVLMSDIDTAYCYRYVNKTYEQWYHVSRENTIGKPMQEIIGKQAFEILKPYVDRALTGELVTVETKYTIKGKSDCYILARYIPHSGENGEVSGLFEMISDITARKKSEQELALHKEHLQELVNERTSQLDASYKELESFCYTVSHDLRSPLRSISGFCNMLTEDYASTIDNTGKDYLARIIKSVKNMGTMIDHLLELSRFTSCEMKYDIVDLSAMAAEVADVMRQNYPGRNVECIIKQGLKVNGSDSLLRIVMENLFDNAWKFTAKNKMARIEFGSRKKGEKQIYYVSDNGAGFNMEYAGELFVPFRRLHNVEDYPGTGVGLASIKRIIQRHGGDIWVNSEPNKGATFSFTLGAASVVT